MPFEFMRKLRRPVLLLTLTALLASPGFAREARGWRAASSRIKALMSRGPALNQKDERGFTPLFESVRKGQLVVADMLISAGARVDIPAPFSWTCLHEAVKRRNRNMVDLLLFRGADPNAKDHWGKTPTHLAYENQDMGMIRLLVAYHAKDPVDGLHWSRTTGVSTAY